MKRYALYGRFSDEQQNPRSADDQIKTCEKYVDEQGDIIVERYADCAISGRTNERPEFNRLMEDATQGKFNAVISEALDRYSRDQADIANFYKHMKYHDIEIFTLGEGVIDELQIGLKGTMNALFSIDLAKKVKRGMDSCVEEGKNVGNVSYGYQTVYELDDNGQDLCDKKGRRLCGRLEINEDEARVVHQIFEWFSEGVGPIEIARRLNEKGISGPKEKKWTDYVIRGNHAEASGILNNTLYNGVRIYGKTRQVRDPKTGTSKTRWKNRSEWKEFPMPHLRIVPDNLWKSVKAKQEEINYVTHDRRLKNPLNPKRRPKYLLSGKMECGVCGSNFNIVGSGNCACSNSNAGKGCKNRKRIKYDAIERAVLSGISGQLLTPERINLFFSEYHVEYERQMLAFDSEQKTLKRESQKVQTRINGILRAIEKGVFTESTQAHLLKLEREKADIESRFTKVAPHKMPNKKLIETYRKKATNLAESLADKEIKHAAMEALRPFIGRIIMTPTETGWEGIMRGDIAALAGIQSDHETTDILLPL